MSDRPPFRIITSSAFAAFILIAAATSPTSAATQTHRIGSVTWHPRRYAGQVLNLVGYPLARRKSYVLFSDEAHGPVSPHDLPVVGKAVAALELHHRYRIKGKFVRGGLSASNGNRYHLELTADPILIGR